MNSKDIPGFFPSWVPEGKTRILVSAGLLFLMTSPMAGADILRPMKNPAKTPAPVPAEAKWADLKPAGGTGRRVVLDAGTVELASYGISTYGYGLNIRFSLRGMNEILAAPEDAELDLVVGSKEVVRLAPGSHRLPQEIFWVPSVGSEELKLEDAKQLVEAIEATGRPAPTISQQADYNEVGKQMALMLHNSHVATHVAAHAAELPVEAELSRRFLDNYLNALDPRRLYFTQIDVDALNAKYGDRIQALLLQRNSMPVATEIYRLFELRVGERVAITEKLMRDQDFTFSGNESVTLSRKAVPWPKNAKEATDLWCLQIKEDILGETLRRERPADLATSQGKGDPEIDNPGVEKNVLLRHKRSLGSIKGADDSRIAEIFLGAVAQAYDPHTAYISSRQMNRFNNKSVGIGASLQCLADGSAGVTGIVKGGPADRKGALRIDDRVIAVDALNTGKPEDMIDILFMRIDEVIDLILGQEGTSVGLKVHPGGGASGEANLVVIQRGKVEIEDGCARGELIEMKSDRETPRRLGVITLPSFYADFDTGKVRCSVDVEKILTRLIDARIDGLVLDLRGNGGGSLEEVRAMTGFFIGRGPVVQVKNTLGQVQVKVSDREKPLYLGPVVLLTDKISASASEILAGALQDYNRAVIVGEASTFGAGTVQQSMDIGRMMPLFAAREGAGFLKISIQKFYRPSGSSTQLEGVKPDVVLPGLTDATDRGERFLDYPLRHDSVPEAPGCKPLDSRALFIPELRKLSQERVNADQDFSYMVQDAARAKGRLTANTLTLNKAARERDIEESDTREKLRNAERRVRFEKMATEDEGHLKFFRIVTENRENSVGLEVYYPSIENNSATEEGRPGKRGRDEFPRWPSGLDPAKREGLAVLEDLVELSTPSGKAGE